MVANRFSTQYLKQGFTLIESIVAMVVMAIAMTVLFSIFFPRVEDSGRPQYIVRASALGQSMMNTILSRGFDENSDSSGGLIRCDDTKNNTDLTEDAPKCLGSAVTGEEQDVSAFDDVDDYQGCWYSNSTQSECLADFPGKSYALTNIVNDDCKEGSSQECYPNFKVIVKVEDANSAELTPNQPDNTHIMKKVTLTISAQRYEKFTLVAYRGNY
ncbi:MAG: type IV pilus modification PilV family protein [Vibrio hibernica]